jgi:acyl-homoserine-lactone acylase
MAYGQSIVVTSVNFADMIATATPPKNETARAEHVSFPDFEQASNGWAIGSERSASGRGMLLANPHYPWVGSNRFWEKHLIIPSQLDVYGVSLLGMPGVAIGFNRAVASLTYSQSGDSASPLYYDQTELFSAKKWGSHRN